MDLAALRLATDLGGILLSGPTPAHALILAERISAHGVATLLVLGREAADLQAPLAAMARTTAPINVVGVLATQATQLPLALAFHRLRIGSLLGAIDAGLPWLAGRPMMAKRLPGRLRASHPVPLDPAVLRPLERADLLACLGHSREACLQEAFLQPAWAPEGDFFVAPWWPGVPQPGGTGVLIGPLTLPSHTPFTEALRGSLRAGSDHPVPWLPHPGDPSELHALAQLTRELAVFRGTEEVWGEALQRLADLPVPPHFCARC